MKIISWNCHYGFFEKNTVQSYCSNINDIELKDDNWIYADIIEENEKITLKIPEILTYFNILSSLDDLSIQKVLRQISHETLSQALKSADKNILHSVLRNISKIEAKMLIEDIKYSFTVSKEATKEARRNIVKTIRHLEDTGEIIVPKFSRAKID
jgi:flagellar motor switch protein FliG